MGQVLETNVTKRIIAYLKSEGAVVWKTHGGPSSRSGVADVIACLPAGRFLAIEVKAPGAKRGATPLQARFLSSVVEAGGIAFVATSVEEVRERLSPCPGGPGLPGPLPPPRPN